MRLSRGASSLLKFLTDKAGRKGFMWWGQRSMATHFDVDIRTIRRWVRELKQSGDVQAARRGSTSSVYTLSKTCGKLRENVLTDRTKCPKEASGSSYMNLSKEKQQQSLAFPQAEIVNEYGRRMPNPEHQRIMEVLRAARGRISAARSPVAYERAVIQAELRAMRKPNGSQGFDERYNLSVAGGGR